LDSKLADSALITAQMNEIKCFNLIDPNKFLMMPHDKFKCIWDVIITILIMVTCIYAPYSLAFEAAGKSKTLIGLDTALNIIFFGDIFINMISAY
jgi:hypothetical protein